jgi:hypothetical protein
MMSTPSSRLCHNEIQINLSHKLWKHRASRSLGGNLGDSIIPLQESKSLQKNEDKQEGEESNLVGRDTEDSSICNLLYNLHSRIQCILGDYSVDRHFLRKEHYK